MEDTKIKNLTEEEMIDGVESLILDLGGDTGSKIDREVLTHTKCKIVQHMVSKMKLTK